MTNTLTVRGQKIRSRSNRRYIVVTVREQPFEDVLSNGSIYMYDPSITIVKRSDSLDTLRTYVNRRGYLGIGLVNVIIDTVTGEEVR